jgi:hypothetical protein
MKIVQKPHSPTLVKINHTPRGGEHPIPPKRQPIKDSKYFRMKKKPKKPKRSF